MPRSATALGINNDIQNFSISAGLSDHWLSDPVQLANWQVQLVDSCHAINQQLKDIRNELTADHDPDTEVASFPFRAVYGERSLQTLS